MPQITNRSSSCRQNEPKKARRRSALVSRPKLRRPRRLMLDCGTLLVSQMSEQDVAQLSSGTAAEGIEDLLVLAHRLAPAVAVRVKVGGVACPLDAAGIADIGRTKRLVPGSGDDGLVDCLVAGEVAIEIAAQIEAVHLVVQGLDRGELGLGDLLASQAPGQGLEPAYDVKQLGQFALAEAADARATVRKKVDEPFRGQDLQGLAEGRARDTELLAELTLGHAGAVAQAPLDDEVPQARQHLSMERGKTRLRSELRAIPRRFRRHGRSGSVLRGSGAIRSMIEGGWWHGTHIAASVRTVDYRQSGQKGLALRKNECKLSNPPANHACNTLRGWEAIMSSRIGRHFLHIPGPSPVPERVMRAMNMPVIDHRGPDFKKLGEEVLEGCKAVFQTDGPVVIYPSSGTGAWEATIANTLNAGDKVLMFETGQFATLWRQMAAGGA